jgi:hypothetical protein
MKNPRFLLALLLAAALAASGCGSSHRSSTTRTTPAKTRTSTVATTPTSTTSTRPSTGPAGGPVPLGTKATSVTLISSTAAFVLGTTPCQQATCSVILRTRDRGRSWQGLPSAA